MENDELAMSIIKEGAKLLLNPKNLERAQNVGRRIRALLNKGKNAAFENPEVADALVDAAVRIVEQKLRETGKNKVEIDWKELPNASSREEAIYAFSRAVFEQRLWPKFGGGKFEIPLGPVPDHLRNRVLEKTGGRFDLSGYSHVIDIDGLVHAWSRHAAGNEKNSSQEPVGPEAIALYLDIVNNPDYIGEVKNSRFGPTLEFIKKIDGLTIVIENIRKGKKNLAFHSMWIEKN